jgi:hypothetical protein
MKLTAEMEGKDATRAIDGPGRWFYWYALIFGITELVFCAIHIYFARDMFSDTGIYTLFNYLYLLIYLYLLFFVTLLFFIILFIVFFLKRYSLKHLLIPASTYAVLILGYVVLIFADYKDNILLFLALFSLYFLFIIVYSIYMLNGKITGLNATFNYAEPGRSILLFVISAIIFVLYFGILQLIFSTNIRLFVSAFIFVVCILLGIIIGIIRRKRGIEI